MDNVPVIVSIMIQVALPAAHQDHTSMEISVLLALLDKFGMEASVLPNQLIQ